MACYVFGGKKVAIEYVLQYYSRISLEVLKNTMKNILRWLVSLPKMELTTDGCNKTMRNFARRMELGKGKYS